MPKKTLFFKIYLAILAVFVILTVTLALLGNVERTGFIKIEHDNIENEKLQIAEGEYVYFVKVNYYDKVFRNSDIYAVHVDTQVLPDYVNWIVWDYDGSPYGYVASSEELKVGESLGDFGYTLSLKRNFILLLVGVFIVVTSIFLFFIYLNNVVSSLKFIFLFFKSHNKFTSIMLLFFCVLISCLFVSLYVLGMKERVGYIEIQKEKNNIELADGEYSYYVRMRYFDNFFTESNLYKVNVNIKSLPEYVLVSNWSSKRSSFGDIKTDYELDNGSYLEEIYYTLQPKLSILIYYLLILTLCISLIAFLNLQLTLRLLNEIIPAFFTRNKKIISIVSMIIVLIIQLAMMIHFGNKKQGFHVDEMFTYSSANKKDYYKNGRLKPEFNIWKKGSDIATYITIEDDEIFNFSIAYNNHKIGVHPPLHFFIINATSSFIPGKFSKWTGLIPNIIFSLLITIILYKLLYGISKNRALAIIYSFMYAFSIGTMTSVMYIRMYTLLSLFCISLAYLHVKLFNEILSKSIKKKTFILLYLCTIGGILTHHYFLIFCFFLCGIFFIFLLIRKNKKDITYYLIAEFGGLLTSVAIFPYLIKHIFGGKSRGGEAFQNFSSLPNYLEKLFSVFDITSGDILGGFLYLFLLTIIFSFLVIKFIKFSKIENSSLTFDLQRFLKIKVSFETIIVCIFAFISIMYLVVVARVSPYVKEARYFMCIYPLCILVVVYLFYKVVLSLSKKITTTSIISIVFFIFMTIISYKMENVGYSFEYYSPRYLILSEYTQYPLIVLDERWGIAEVNILEYPQYENVYMTRRDDLYKLLENGNDVNLDDGFLLYVTERDLTEDDIKALFSENGIYLKSIELLTSINGMVYFCLPEYIELPATNEVIEEVALVGDN